MLLLRHFPELTQYPFNAEKLMALVLQMAVQGKLTRQWRQHHPELVDGDNLASRLFEIIRAEKEDQVESGIYKAKFDTDKFEELIKRPKIPSQWKYCTVGSICELLTGATPSTSKSENFGGEIKWLVSGDIHKEEIYDCEGRITDQGLQSSNCKILPVDSVLIALNGQGKTRATVALLKTPATCNQSLVAMKPYLHEETLSKYIYLSLRGKYYQIREVTGQKQRRGLNMTLVSQLPIPLPPLAEQKEIVRIVDQLKEEIDELNRLNQERIQLKNQFVVSSLHHLTNGQDHRPHWNLLKDNFHDTMDELENIKKLRETILQLAVQGKLTEKWRQRHPELVEGPNAANQLLEKIKTEKARLIKEGKIKKEKPLPEITQDEIPFDLPEGWVWCRLKDVVSKLGDGIHGTPKYDIHGQYHFVNGNNLNDGEIEIKPNTKTVSESEYQTHKRELNQSTVLVSINGTIGNTAFYNDEKIILGKSACYFNLLNGIDKEYIRDAVKTPYFMKYALDEATGTTIKNVSLRTMRNFRLSLPPLPEQKEIVRIVDQLMAHCDELENHVKYSQSTAEKLMESVVREVVFV